MALNQNGKKLMNRSEFREKFHSSGPVILPVIHVIDSGQTAANIDKLLTAGIKGCFLINHDFDVETFLPIIRSIRAAYPDFWLGLNFLGVTGLDAFPVLASLSDEGSRIDAYWADDARIDERTDDQSEADAIADMLKNCGWQGLYFGGTAFKKQRPVNPGDYAASARIAGGYMDVVTTSGWQRAMLPILARSPHSEKRCPINRSPLLQGLHLKTLPTTAMWIASWLRQGSILIRIFTISIRQSWIS